jgi:hypothetical protein
MYIVKVELAIGGHVETQHETATAAFSRIVEARQHGAKVIVVDGNSHMLTDNDLMKLMATEEANTPRQF